MSGNYKTYDDALAAFQSAYVTAALWSSTDAEGNPLDNGGYELSDEAQEKLDADAKAFFDAYSQHFTTDNCKHRGCSPIEYAGHDFWLTRCGHGCGFWDGDWKEPAASLLTEAARKAGNADLYVGDDGLVYVM